MKLLNRFLSIVFIVFLPLLLALVATPLYAMQTDISPPTQIQSFDDLPQGLAYAISSALQDKLPSTYNLNRVQSGFLAKNIAHGISFNFTNKGPRLTNKNNTWQWSMTLTRWGRSKSLRKALLGTLFSKGPRMEYKRGASLSEWYLNTPWGLEQGFTVNNKPSTQKDIPSSLILELTLSGTLKPSLQGNTLLLSDSTGQTCIRYTGLYAFDKEGKTLDSRLALKGDILRILIDDSMASYPITIDPWVQKDKLTVWFGKTGDYFGSSVAIDGDTVVVGAPQDDFGGNTDQGSAYVFEKSGNSWTRTGELIPNDGEDYDYFGSSVAIDGDTVVVGAPHGFHNSPYQGSAYVFKKSGNIWYQTAKITASDGVANDSFGVSVAIDGHHVVVGASRDYVFDWRVPGSAYVFSYMYLPVYPPVYLWTQTAKLTESDGAMRNEFGGSVSISGDTVVVGAAYDDSNQGSAYVFEKPGISWVNMTPTAKLTASDPAINDLFGYSVSISGDTVVVGAIGDDDKGSAYVFEKPGVGWVNMTPTANLMANNGADSTCFGISVSISGDTVVVGAAYDGSNQGSAYVFEKPGISWVNMTPTAKLTASDGAADDHFGRSVAIDGDTVVVGVAGDDFGGNTNQGSAYVFEVTPNITPVPNMTPLAPVLMLLLENRGGSI